MLFIRALLRFLFRVEVTGIENYYAAGDKVLIIANHSSFLDPPLLTAFIPNRVTFAVNTHVAKNILLRLVSRWVDLFPMDPTNPLSLKGFIAELNQNKQAIIFPEGRITMTGALMKIYDGPGLAALKSGAFVLPVRIDGAQYTYFSRLKGRVRLRLFPKITITFLPPQKITVDEGISSREARKIAGQQLTDIMTNMVFQTSPIQTHLMDALLTAKNIHGDHHLIAEDINREPLSYKQLFIRSLALGKKIDNLTKGEKYIGLLLPNSISTIVTFVACQIYNRVPAMLNYSSGEKNIVSAIETTTLKTVITSRRFIEQAKLEGVLDAVNVHCDVIYLEDIRETITGINKLSAFIKLLMPENQLRKKWSNTPHTSPAVILFTSGSEGVPKGVALAHSNLLANIAQVAARVDFSAQDIILNALPLFHSFGLTAATLLPILNGVNVFLYPSPVHYRVVPEIAYDTNATILFGTNTFLKGYARSAHPYDFYSIRYVFAGAEKLQDDTRDLWIDQFGLRVFEGYGATETSPVLAVNSPMNYQRGSVGRLLPHIEYQLQNVPGISEGGRLFVRGPNIMCGYLRHENPGALEPPTSELGDGWYDTGDIVVINAEGYVFIKDRVKRFAKIGGEMISLSAVEQFVLHAWPEHQHAVVNLPDAQKGETLVLLTDYKQAERSELGKYAREHGIAEINVPKNIFIVDEVPLLGTGKIDYPTAKQTAIALMQTQPQEIETAHE
jgi:acyl-[acyl-carrier-protein]-phospholipid O-acyltransferase/long-chain-fatty-acid--[acyl-carrier-protein] ligase